jgi:putative methyltransferase (TIGR04325 family)
MLKDIAIYLKYRFSPLRFSCLKLNRDGNLYGYDNDELLSELFLQEEMQCGAEFLIQDGIKLSHHVFDFELWYLLISEYHRTSEKLVIVDIGGAFGATYKTLPTNIQALIKTWYVVEQPKIVQFCQSKEHSFDANLKFIKNLDSIIDQNVNLIYLGSSLQYLPKPESYLADVLGLKARYIKLSRTPFVFIEPSLEITQICTPPLKRANYSLYAFNYDEFSKKLNTENYVKLYENASSENRRPFQIGRYIYFKNITWEFKK